jgi:hypothetical protein
MSRRVGVCPRRKDHLRVGRLPSAQGRRKNHGTPLDAVLDLNKRAERGRIVPCSRWVATERGCFPRKGKAGLGMTVSGLPPRPPCGHQQNGRTPRTTQDMYAMPSAFGSNRACPRGGGRRLLPADMGGRATAPPHVALLGHDAARPLLDARCAAGVELRAGGAGALGRAQVAGDISPSRPALAARAPSSPARKPE